MPVSRTGPSGVDFFDGDDRYCGRAARVTRRVRPVLALESIDVAGADPQLTTYLRRLDRGRLLVQESGTGNPLFSFRWASGYFNGDEIRVQGAIEEKTARRPDEPSGLPRPPVR
jgi:hypothetical protein